MSLVGNVQCCREDAGFWRCACPVCEGMRSMAPYKKPKRLRLTRKDVELIADILQTHSLDSHRRHLQKSEFSPEHMALLRLSRDAQAVVEKLNAVLKGGDRENILNRMNEVVEREGGSV